MNPAPTAHHHPDRERRIPSGLEAGAAFALGTAAPMHYASPLLAAIATVALYLGGGLLSRWPALPTVARPPAGRTAWLCAIFCLGWLGAVRAPGREPGATEPGEKDALAGAGEPIAGTIRGVVANLPVLRRALFSRHPDRLKYADFQLEETESGRVFQVRAEISGTKLPTGLEPGALVKGQGKIYPRRATQEVPRRRPAAIVIRALPGGLSIRPGPPPAPGLRLRWRVLELINRMYSDREQGLFCALIVGEKRLLDQELRLHFIETGTAHFLAISGLHVGLVMLLAMRIPFPRRGKTALRLLVLGVFVLLSGANTPVLRAALMIALHLLLQAAGRIPKTLDTLGWTLLALLSLDPTSIHDPGFQLSFVATTAILASLSTRARETREKRLLLIPSKPTGKLPLITQSVISAIRSCFWISLVSTAVTAPLIATYFGRFHPLSPLLSVCIYPLVALSLVLGLASVLMGFLWIELGCIAAEAAAFFAHLLQEFLAFTRTIPGHCLYLPAPDFTLSLVFYLLLGAGLSRKTRIPALLVSTLVLPIVLILNLVPIDGGNLRLTHIDTRAGSAALLEIPASKSAFLVDACGSTPEASRRLVSTLLRAGHRRIDGIFLTHPHADHAGALPLLSQVLDVGTVFCSAHFERDERGKRLLEAARRAGVRISKVGRGDLLKLPGPRKSALRILYPAREEPLALSRKANDMSLSLVIESSGRRIICLGDLEESGLARLFTTGEELGSEVLVLPHHGRSNKLYDALLEKVRPELVVISGDGRGGGEATLQRLEQSGIKVYSTWRGGGILNEWTRAGIRTSYLGR